MYNLLISGAEDAWDKEFYEYDAVRVFEYCSESITKKYDIFNKTDAEELQKYPALFVYEDTRGKEARVGWITKVLTRSKEVRVHYKFDSDISPIPPAKIKELEWDLGIDDWELNRTHWALKDVDLVGVLSEAKILETNSIPKTFIGQMESDKPASNIQINPLVFRIPEKTINPKLVSVMMPFDESMSAVYESLKQACSSIGFECQRADNIWEASEIIQDIFSLIYVSRIVVCDFSGRNSNVFYEAGIAHTLGRHVIPIVQSKDDIPFDLRHHRFIEYKNSEAGLKELQSKVIKRIETITR